MSNLVQFPTFMTDPTLKYKLESKNKAFNIYKIEDSVPPQTFEQQYSSLPSAVFFERIITNVITSLNITSVKAKTQQQQNKDKSLIQKWNRYLSLEQNKAVVSDCFWYAICKFFHKDQYQNSEENLEKRIAKNYIALTLSIQDKNDNKLFFKEYFDVVAQSVFYSFFYAYPKSRSEFNDQLKNNLLSIFSKMFTGIEISKTSHYIQKWNLDLGTGNILLKNKKRDEMNLTNKSNLSMEPRTKKRQQLGIRYSPIVELYLKTHKYKTRNYVPEFKMKYTQLDKDRFQIDQKFKKYKEQSDKILEWSEKQKKQDEKKKKQLEDEIKAIKRQTINHNKRLDKRKAQELQRGAHQYANYLVSMLNAGIAMTSLGIVRKNL